MIVLAIDPASHTTGYAVADVRDQGTPQLIDAGVLKPAQPNVRGPVFDRVRDMAGDVVGLVNEYKPQLAVVEIPAGKVHAGRHGGRGAGLATYGLAAGYLLAVVERSVTHVAAVTDLEWTEGKSKAWRATAVELVYPSRIQTENDPHYDAVDAVGLVLWWQRRYGSSRERVE
jgi:Holliday junction resolvasome RuvABC endonuclease subunit